MEKVLIAIGVAVFFILLYIGLYILNKKTPVPKGCEDVKDLESKCAGCQNTECSFRKKEVTHNE